MKKIDRRRFLQSTAIAAAYSSPLFSLLSSAGRALAAAGDAEYKAIVCILLEGGADSFNMVVPGEGNAYTAYRAARDTTAINASSLRALTPTSYNDGVQYGFHPAMERMHSLFTAHKLAVIGNVGTLVQPVTKTQVENGAPVPNQLFAHNTQRDLWMTANAATAEKSGWAARMADIMAPDDDLFNIAVGGKNLMQQGGVRSPFEFSGGDIYAFDDYYAFREDGALGSSYLQLLQQSKRSANALIQSFSGTRTREINLFNQLSGIFENAVQFDTFPDGVHESGMPLGKQLEAVAKMLSVREALPGSPRKQVYFVNYHDWDTHNSSLLADNHKVDYLDKALGAFADALAQLHLENQVTTFTISDFGRSITPNGAGTDHGWGGHAYVMGGAVNGGDIYGRMPRIEPNSPDATGDRVIPTTSVEQYLATIATWFGASQDALETIFPNLRSFNVRNLGFMS